MNSSPNKLIRASRAIGAAMTQLRGKLEVFFLSKPESARRAAARVETLTRQERLANEAERLDRIRNPADYRGR